MNRSFPSSLRKSVQYDPSLFNKSNHLQHRTEINPCPLDTTQCMSHTTCNIKIKCIAGYFCSTHILSFITNATRSSVRMLLTKLPESVHPAVPNSSIPKTIAYTSRPIRRQRISSIRMHPEQASATGHPSSVLPISDAAEIHLHPPSQLGIGCSSIRRISVIGKHRVVKLQQSKFEYTLK